MTEQNTTPKIFNAILSVGGHIKAAEKYQGKWVRALERIKRDLGEEGEFSSELHERFIRHILQLRMDQIDLLKSLSKLNKSYTQALGIDPLADQSRNLDHLLSELGHEGIKDVLGYLSSLLHLLEGLGGDVDKAKREVDKKHLKKILELLKQYEPYESKEPGEKQKKDKKAGRKFEKTKKAVKYGHIHSIEHDLHEALELQSNFQHSIEQLTEAFHKYSGLPEFGIFYDYVATLKGPISRFSEATRHGVTTVKSFAERLSSEHRQQPAQRLQHDVKSARTMMFHTLY